MNPTERIPAAPRPESGWPIVFTFVAAGAYTAWSVVHEVGLAGWINHVQQLVFGAYATNLSVVLTFSIVAIGLGFVVDRWMAWRRPRGATAPAVPAPDAPAPNPPSALAYWGGIWVALLVIVWVIGLGSWGWQARQELADARGDYRPTRADASHSGEPPAYMALSGRLHDDLAVEHRVGSGTAERSDYRLVPMGSLPVRYLVRLTPGALGLAGLRPQAERTLLVHVDGPVPVPAAQAFARGGVPLRGDAVVLRVVPSDNGQPTVRPRARQDLETMVKLCLGASALFTLGIGVLAVFATRERRSRAA